jgi:cytochrome c553
MKLINIQAALHAALLSIALTAVSQAEAANETAVSQKDLQAKIQFCKTCHGLSGQGFRGTAPMPRLAGQPVKYLDNQLQAFSERRRDNKFMYGVSHAMSPAMRAALIKYFSGLNPRPLDTGSSPLAAEGKKIYEGGIDSAKIPPCASCHGPQAKGNDDFPRLAGQLHDYIINKLENWSKERGLKPSEPDTSAIMAPIAHELTKQQVEAVAAYLSTLE